MSKKIIEEHCAGILRVENDEEGALFTLFFLLMLKGKNESAVWKWLSYSQHLTLLYVEDNDDARMGGLFILEELFGNVIVAHDGEEGLQKFKDNTIDIVMTDVNMPKMNGLEMVNAIRLLNAQTPILIVSAYNESGYFIESIRHGVDGIC